MEKELSMYMDPAYYTNRELSWIKFNERVLSEARDKNLPLFERLKFLSITESNLDEFFKFLLMAPVTGISYQKNGRQLGYRQIFRTVQIGLTAQFLIIRKFENVKVSLKEKELIIQVDTPEDIILEMGLFAEKAAFFEEVFSIRTSIHQKKRM